MSVCGGCHALRGEVGEDPGLDDIGEVEAEAHIARHVTVIPVPPASAFHYCIAPPCLPHIHYYLKPLHTRSLRPHTLVALRPHTLVA